MVTFKGGKNLCLHRIIGGFFPSSVSFGGITEHLSMRGLHSCLSYPRGLGLVASDKSMYLRLLWEEWTQHKHLPGTTAVGWGQKGSNDVPVRHANVSHDSRRLLTVNILMLVRIRKFSRAAMQTSHCWVFPQFILSECEDGQATKSL